MTSPKLRRGLHVKSVLGKDVKAGAVGFGAAAGLYILRRNAVVGLHDVGWRIAAFQHVGD